MKKCIKCNKIKGIEQYHKLRNGRHNSCSECRNAQKRQWHFKNKEYIRQYRKIYNHKNKQHKIVHNMEYRYGLTINEYESLLKIQKGLCKACGLPESSKSKHGVIKKLSVDHDHKTGDIRGLLCVKCNLALGFLDDDPQKILGLHKYICQAIENSI